MSVYDERFLIPLLYSTPSSFKCFSKNAWEWFITFHLLPLSWSYKDDWIAFQSFLVALEQRMLFCLVTSHQVELQERKFEVSFSCFKIFGRPVELCICCEIFLCKRVLICKGTMWNKQTMIFFLRDSYKLYLFLSILWNLLQRKFFILVIFNYKML